VLISSCRIHLTFPPTPKICISSEPQHVECKLGFGENPQPSRTSRIFNCCRSPMMYPLHIVYTFWQLLLELLLLRLPSLAFDSSRHFGLANYQKRRRRRRRLLPEEWRGCWVKQPIALWVDKEFSSLNWHVGELRSAPVWNGD